jgi:hypothetical protein
MSAVKPIKATADSFSDPSLGNINNSGEFYGFTNVLTTPILKANTVQLTRANFINNCLQLNDQNQLTFWYYRTAATTTAFTTSNLYCVRLLPNWFIPASGFSAFTKNKYFNTVAELVAQLNVAAAAGGDSITYNTRWLSGDVTFTYDSTTRKISLTGNTATNYYSPADISDPNVQSTLKSNTAITMNSAGGVIVQPYSLNVAMNSRLGFAQKYGNRPRFATSSSRVGCATLTGVPIVNGTATEADSFPILLGTQNVNVFINFGIGQGIHSAGIRKNLLATIPIEVAPLNVNSYTLNSVETPAITFNSDIYEIKLDFTDDFGNPFPMPPGYNANFELIFRYN